MRLCLANGGCNAPLPVNELPQALRRWAFLMIWVRCGSSMLRRPPSVALLEVLSCCRPFRPPLRLSLRICIEALAIWGYILSICGARRKVKVNHLSFGYYELCCPMSVKWSKQYTDAELLQLSCSIA